MKPSPEDDKRTVKGETEQFKTSLEIKINIFKSVFSLKISKLLKNKIRSSSLLLKLVIFVLRVIHPIINTLDIEGENKKELDNRTSVIELITYSKISRDSKAYVFFVITAIFLVFLNIKNIVGISYMVIPFLGIISIYLNEKIIAYRINKGWFGNNYYEAREIIKFIDEHFDKDDFFDGGEMKNMYPDSKKTIKTQSAINNGLNAS